MDVQKIESYTCPVSCAIGVIGGKYKAVILYELVGRTLRFSELQRSVPGITARMLSRQLKELENDGIVSRVQYPVMPPKTEYSLTKLGNTLVPLIKGLCDWGEAYFNAIGVPNPCTTVNPHVDALATQAV